MDIVMRADRWRSGAYIVIWFSCVIFDTVVAIARKDSGLLFITYSTLAQPRARNVSRRCWTKCNIPTLTLTSLLPFITILLSIVVLTQSLARIDNTKFRFVEESSRSCSPTPYVKTQSLPMISAYQIIIYIILKGQCPHVRNRHTFSI